VLTMRRYTAMTPFDACSLSVASRGTYKFTGKERDSESNLDYMKAGGPNQRREQEGGFLERGPNQSVVPTSRALKWPATGNSRLFPCN
jgi:hypothetical protein